MNGILNHAFGEYTVGQAALSYGVNAAAFLATGGIAQISALATLEVATIAGAASGAIIGGGNVALQGGSGADIFAGAVGGALIGGSTAFLGSAVMMGLGEIASKIPANWLDYAHSDGWLKLSNQGISLLDAYNELNYRANGFFSSSSGIGGGLGGVGAGNLFQFASYQSSPVNLLTSSDPIGDIFQRVHYLNSTGSGLKDRHLSEIILQNGYGRTSTVGPFYHEYINRDGHIFSLMVHVPDPYLKGRYRYNVFNAGWGYLDKDGYPFNPEFNEGFHSGFWIQGYEDDLLIKIGAKPKNYFYLKRLFNRYKR